MIHNLRHGPLAAAAVFLFALLVLPLAAAYAAGATKVLQEGDKVYIVDKTGERWDVTLAVSIGFEAEDFQHGIGRNAITPLGGEALESPGEKGVWVAPYLRVIGYASGGEAEAYSVCRMFKHEVVNSTVGGRPVAAVY